ncbi:MAG: hypothetical protein HYZ15_12790 [Sphingobacteriales bacterium]|nr:hypothetical protein [Sphingobacteriales bacterium]
MKLPTKLKNEILITAALFATIISVAQSGNVGIGTSAPNSNAALELAASNKGFLPNRVSLTATNSPLPLTAHIEGMLVYNTATTGTSPLNVYPGWYYNDGTKWVRLASNNFGNTKVFATGTFTCPYNGGSGGTGFATGLNIAIPSDGWYYIESGLTIGSDCNDYWMYINTPAGAADIWRVYCSVAANSLYVPREQSRMLFLTAGSYPILAGKSNLVVPTQCNIGNPVVYVSVVKIQN